MRITNRWNTGDGWDFHIFDKDLWRKLIGMGKTPDISTLIDLKMKPEWLQNHGEEDPVNWAFLNGMRTAYFEWLDNERITVPEAESKVMVKVWNFVLALYKQDSAYFERMGGVITVIVINEQKWKDTRKVSRLRLLKELRDWFHKSDQRPRTINWLIWIFDYMIKKYDKVEFYQKSIDFCIDYILAHRSEWVIHDWFSPKMWYPAGRGQLTNKVYGGDS